MPGPDSRADLRKCGRRPDQAIDTACPVRRPRRHRYPPPEGEHRGPGLYRRLAGLRRGARRRRHAPSTTRRELHRCPSGGTRRGHLHRRLARHRARYVTKPNAIADRQPTASGPTESPPLRTCCTAMRRARSCTTPPVGGRRSSSSGPPGGPVWPATPSAVSPPACCATPTVPCSSCPRSTVRGERT